MSSCVNRRASYAFGLALLSVLALACSTGQEGSEEDAACVLDSNAVLFLGSTMAGEAGEYILTMVASRGAVAGDTVVSRLTLMENPEDLRVIQGASGRIDPNSKAPLYGWTDLDLTALGAIDMGGLDSEDPAAPGVAVFETTRLNDAVDPFSVTLRFGSAANRRDLTPFDGAYSVLRVNKIDEVGFHGTWSSGTNTVQAAGHFCAVRRDG